MPLFILQCSFPLCPSVAVPWVLQASTPIDGTGDKDPGPYEPLLCLLSRMLTNSTDGVGENVPWYVTQNAYRKAKIYEDVENLLKYAKICPDFLNFVLWESLESSFIDFLSSRIIEK